MNTALTITAVGDMMFDTRLRPPRVFYYQPEFASCLPSSPQRLRFPFVNRPDSRRWLASRSGAIHGVDASAHASQSIALNLPADAGDADYPFRAMRDRLRRADILFGNLECPLSARGRRMSNDQCYAASPAFAAALADASFQVVSLANNHAMDYGEPALCDTLDALRDRGIAVAGAGRNIDEARRPVLFEIDGTRVAFLAYCLVGHDWLFAGDGECGVAPLNPFVIEQDIAQTRRQADVVLVSVHWGAELMAQPWRGLIDLAHRIVDCGADGVLGHHSHVPGSVEIYRGRPILYSLGNFCFGHDHHTWRNNMIATIEIVERRIQRVEFVPIGGSGLARYQPFVLDGPCAHEVHQQVAQLSAGFGTSFQVDDDTGHFSLILPAAAVAPQP